jgi:two-component system cell cycle sensor histidine kinase/response regulator CckA
VRDELQEVIRAAERAAELTQQLLAFSRQQPVEPRRLDLGAIVAESERMLRRFMGENVEVRLSLATDVPLVVSDPGRINQILLNLCANARDASRRAAR